MADEAVRHLLDIEAIKALKANYGRVVDGVVSDSGTARVEEFDAVFAPGAVADFPGTLGRHVGLDALKALFGQTLAESRSAMWHSFHSPIISVDGDQASGAWTILALVRGKGEAGPPAQVYGRYLETYARTPDGWRIQTLTFHKE